MERNAIKRVDGRLVAMVTPTFSVSLGHDAGGDGSCTGFWNANVITRVRERLVAEDRYPVAVKVSGARAKNFIEPSKVAADVDVPAESRRELLTMLERGSCSLSRRIARSVRGVRVIERHPGIDREHRAVLGRPDQTRARGVYPVGASVEEDAHRGATIAAALVNPRPSDCVLNGVRRPTAARSTLYERHRRVLRADAAARGGGMKLYAKHDRLLRFEAEFSNDRISKLIGRRIRVDDASEMTNDLERLGRGAYARLLVAQSNLQCDQVLSIGELVASFLPDSLGAKVQTLVETFAGGQKFHHTGRSHERELARLKRRGLVEYTRVWNLGATTRAACNVQASPVLEDAFARAGVSPHWPQEPQRHRRARCAWHARYQHPFADPWQLASRRRMRAVAAGARSTPQEKKQAAFSEKRDGVVTNFLRFRPSSSREDAMLGELPLGSSRVAPDRGAGLSTSLNACNVVSLCRRGTTG